MNRRSRAPWAALALLLPTVVFAQGAPQPERTHTVRTGDSLAGIAAQAYGDGGAWPALMLGTNQRLAEGIGLSFVGDPNSLVPGQLVWVPSLEAKDRWMARYRAYVVAVLDMSLPQPWEVSRRLLVVDVDAPLRVVTWARDGQFELGTAPAGRQIWVTVVPHLQRFCRDLEDRLGMPPASNKTVFVEIELGRPSEDLFRPCVDPRLGTANSPLGPPPADADAGHREWFLSQYFASYAEAHPTRFPWTSLGYTYDWGDPVSEEGESEFVIRPEAGIEVVSIASTEDYCRP